jgi:hypothetical protein
LVSSPDRSACMCAAGEQRAMTGVPVGVLPDAPTIRLRVDSGDGTVAFSPEGQVSGRLETFVTEGYGSYVEANSFLPVCLPWGDPITDAEASVACRELGDALGYDTQSSSLLEREDTDDGPSSVNWAATVACEGTEASLSDCSSFSYKTTSRCGNPEYVRCCPPPLPIPTPPPPLNHSSFALT